MHPQHPLLEPALSAKAPLKWADSTEGLPATEGLTAPRACLPLRACRPGKFCAGQTSHQPNDAIAILATDGPAGCFPTYGKARSVLMDLWFEAHQMIAEDRKGASLSPIEARNNRVANPAPTNIGCPYASWSGANKCTYW